MKIYSLNTAINTFGKHYSNSILNTVLGILSMEYYTPNSV